MSGLDYFCGFAHHIFCQYPSCKLCFCLSYLFSAPVDAKKATDGVEKNTPVDEKQVTAPNTNNGIFCKFFFTRCYYLAYFNFLN